METANLQALDQLIGPGVGTNLLQEALDEISKEEIEKKRAGAKELIRKAMDLKAQMVKAERDFNSNKAKFDKELGKTLNRIKNYASGRPAEEGEAEEAQNT